MFTKRISLLVSIAIIFCCAQKSYAEIPFIPYGPEELMFTCQQKQTQGECSGTLLDQAYNEVSFQSAQRRTKFELRKVHRKRSRARKKGHRSVVLRSISDGGILRKVQKGISRCMNYRASNCTLADPGYNNTLFSDVCEAFGTTSYKADEDERYQSNVHQRIVNGAICNFHDTPIVPIDFRGSQYCTGNVIGERVILTAAHCIESIPCEQLSVTNGSGLRRHAISCVMHPDYDGDELHDMALIYLKESIETNIIPIHPVNDMVRGEPAIFAGYGLSETYSYPQLRGSRNYLTRTEDSGLVVFYDSRDITMGNTCYGDSGGPLAVLRDGVWTLVGVVSNGDAYNCALPGYERTDVSRWTNITSPSNMKFLRDYTSGIVDSYQ